MSKALPARLLAPFLAVLMALAASCGAPEEPPPDRSERLREAVTPQGILEHTRRLEEIAAENGGNRAAGTPGYDASADYVANRLRQAGYEVTIQRFEFPSFEELSPPRLEVIAPERLAFGGDGTETLEYSGAGDVTAPLRRAGPGCEAADFRGFEGGSVALLRRGGCSFGAKAANAEASGAAAAVVFDPSGTGAFSGTLGEPGTGIPVVGVGSAAGEELVRLSRGGDTEVRVETRTRSGDFRTSNVIAASEGGGDTVMVGAHLDSVPDGPGINDNGSGVATVLEIAEEMRELGIEPRNRVRFAFWGAEEPGLLGSGHYAAGLSEQEIQDISVYLNFDMLGSPNGARFVYDDRGNPRGSGRIEEAFTDYFASQNLTAEPDDTLVGRSDHGPFADRGVPVGGLFSGAEGIKTAREAQDYGGERGEPHDRCYHQACDTAANLDHRLLDQMSDAAAHATLRFAEAG